MDTVLVIGGLWLAVLLGIPMLCAVLANRML